MNPEQKVAFIQARTVAAMAEILGMEAENKQREVLGHSMAYVHQDFCSVIDIYGIGHNDVISFFQD